MMISITFRCENCGRCWMRHGDDLAITIDECPDCGGRGRIFTAESLPAAKAVEFTNKAPARFRRLRRRAT